MSYVRFGPTAVHAKIKVNKKEYASQDIYVNTYGWVKERSVYPDDEAGVTASEVDPERPDFSCSIDLSMDIDGKPLNVKITSIGA